MKRNTVAYCMGVSSQTFGTQSYLSSKEAGRISGYTSDYISRLARQGKVIGVRIGTQWFVEPKSLDSFLHFAEQQKEERKKKLQLARRREREKQKHVASVSHVANPNRARATAAVVFDSFGAEKIDATMNAHREALFATVAGCLAAVLMTFGLGAVRPLAEQVAAVGAATAHTAVALSTELATKRLSLLGAAGVAHTDATVASHDAAAMQQEHVAEGGIVVLPQRVTEATVDYVKKAFSDDVEVTLDKDQASGVITPVFADNKKGDAYRFVLVPLTHTAP